METLEAITASIRLIAYALIALAAGIVCFLAWGERRRS